MPDIILHLWRSLMLLISEWKTGIYFERWLIQGWWSRLIKDLPNNTAVFIVTALLLVAADRRGLPMFTYSSGSQTFLVRGPLRKIWWSAKYKILNYIGIRGPLQLILRTTSGPRSRLWESLTYRDRTRP